MQILSIPAKGFQLLVPVSMVAQVTGRVALTPAVLNIPGVGGMIRWRHINLPVFRTTELMGGNPLDDENYRQIVVLWPMKSAGSQSYLALTSLGTPEVLTVSDLSAAEGVATMPWALAYAELPDAVGVVPDLDGLAQQAWQAAGRDESSP